MKLKKLAPAGTPHIGCLDGNPYVVSPDETVKHGNEQLRFFDRELSPVEQLDIMEAFETLLQYRDYSSSVAAAIDCLMGNSTIFGVRLSNTGFSLSNLKNLNTYSCHFDNEIYVGGIPAEGIW